MEYCLSLVLMTKPQVVAVVQPLSYVHLPQTIGLKNSMDYSWRHKKLDGTEQLSFLLHSPPGSSVHGILQARILEEWVAISSSGECSQSISPALAGEFFTNEPPGKPTKASRHLSNMASYERSSRWPSKWPFFLPVKGGTLLGDRALLTRMKTVKNMTTIAAVMNNFFRGNTEDGRRNTSAKQMAPRSPP